MANWLHLTLDTTAPQLTWGAVSGATAGERLRVGYTLNEPRITAASLDLPDGRTVALVDTGLTLEANLPFDAADGWATVRVRVIDDLLNEATRTLRVGIGGVIVVPEPTPAGGLPRAGRRRRQPDARTIRSRTPVATTTSSWLVVLERGKVGIAVTTSAARSTTSMTSTAGVTAASRDRVTARRVEAGSTRTLGREGTVTRRDGPITEALLLDLI